MLAVMYVLHKHLHTQYRHCQVLNCLIHFNRQIIFQLLLGGGLNPLPLHSIAGGCFSQCLSVGVEAHFVIKYYLYQALSMYIKFKLLLTSLQIKTIFRSSDFFSMQFSFFVVFISSSFQALFFERGLNSWNMTGRQ